MLECVGSVFAVDKKNSKRVMETVNRNIVEGDTLSYHMRFDGSRAKKKEKQETFGF